MVEELCKNNKDCFIVTCGAQLYDLILYKVKTWKKITQPCHCSNIDHIFCPFFATF